MAKQLPKQEEETVTLTARVPVSVQLTLRAAAGDMKFSAFLSRQLIAIATKYERQAQ